MSEKCYICPSTAVDDHHVDCNEGKLSPETVPLCRRCHRTYHDLGLDWFDDDILDKAIELENRHREIINSKTMVDKAEVVAMRSDYWYKKHGLTKSRTPVKARAEGEMRDKNLGGYLERELLYQGCTEPLCGKEWLANELARVDTRFFNQSMTIIHDGRVIGEFNTSTKRGEIKHLMKGTKTKVGGR